MKYKLIDRSILAFFILNFLLLVMVITSYAMFSGSHTLYENKTAPSDFCKKCHPDKVATLNLASNAHKSAGCICHGYNPNASAAYNVNAAHNLTKNIYCTDCHADYNATTGNITINQNISTSSQSAHYMIGSSNRSAVYQHARDFFNGSRR